MKPTPEPQAKSPATPFVAKDAPAQPPAAAPARRAQFDLASARRIAAASRKAGFPVPPHVQAVLDAAAPAEPAAPPA